MAEGTLSIERTLADGRTREQNAAITALVVALDPDLQGEWDRSIPRPGGDVRIRFADRQFRISAEGVTTETAALLGMDTPPSSG